MRSAHGSARGSNLVLLGFRVAGVAAAAHAAAEALGYSLVDTAERIAEGTGLSPADIAETFGEHRLRAIETGMVRELPRLRDAVILPSRGMAEDAEGRQFLRRAGWVAYIRPGREDLVRRFLRQAARIRAGGGGFDVAAEAESLFDRLDPVFRAAADIVLDAGGCRPEILAERIVARFRGFRTI